MTPEVRWGWIEQVKTVRWTSGVAAKAPASAPTTFAVVSLGQEPQSQALDEAPVNARTTGFAVPAHPAAAQDRPPAGSTLVRCALQPTLSSHSRPNSLWACIMLLHDTS